MFHLLRRHTCVAPKRCGSAVRYLPGKSLIPDRSQVRHTVRPICSLFDDQPPKRKKQPYVKPPARPVPIKTSDDGTPQKQWLAKALAAAGVAARRKCEDLIKDGRVKLNGRTVNELLTQVDVTTDKVQVDNVYVKFLIGPKRFYLALNKPKGYICSSVEPDQRGRRAVDLLKTWLKQRRQKDGVEPRLFTVGRLDVATQGLIFLTNDGVWAQSISHPKHGITKEYEVVVPTAPSRQQLQRILGGCVVDGRFVRPVRVSYLPQLSNGRGRLRVTVKDGRNREATESETLSLPSMSSHSYIKRNHRVAPNQVQDMWDWNVREWDDMESVIDHFQAKQREYDSVKRYRDGRPKRQKKHKEEGLTFKPMSAHPNVFDAPKAVGGNDLDDEEEVLEWDLSAAAVSERAGKMLPVPGGSNNVTSLQPTKPQLSPTVMRQLHRAAQGDSWGEAAVGGANGLQPFTSKKRVSSSQGHRKHRWTRRRACGVQHPSLALVYQSDSHSYHSTWSWMWPASGACCWVQPPGRMRALPAARDDEDAPYIAAAGVIADGFAGQCSIEDAQHSIHDSQSSTHGGQRSMEDGQHSGHDRQTSTHDGQRSMHDGQNSMHEHQSRTDGQHPVAVGKLKTGISGCESEVSERHTSSKGDRDQLTTRHTGYDQTQLRERQTSSKGNRDQPTTRHTNYNDQAPLSERRAHPEPRQSTRRGQGSDAANPLSERDTGRADRSGQSERTTGRQQTARVAKSRVPGMQMTGTARQQLESTQQRRGKTKHSSKVNAAVDEEQDNPPLILDAEFFGPDGSLLDEEEIKQLLHRRRREQATQEQQRQQEQQKRQWESIIAKKTDDFCCTDDPDWLVRVLVANAGLEVVELTRIRIGGFCIPETLGVGEYMELQPSDLASITDPKAQEAASKQLGGMMRAA